MTASLCVVLPVRNAQAELADHASAILEVLPELAASFELLVIDNGSTDATLDVAHELELRFPQIAIVRHSAHADRQRIVNTALANTQAELILLCDEDCHLELRDLHKLWRSRGDYDAVLGWLPGAGAIDEETCGRRMTARRLRIAEPRSSAEIAAGYQLLHRRVLEKVRWTSRDRYELLAELSRHGFRWQVVEIRPAIRATEIPGQSMRFDDRRDPVSGPSAIRRDRLSAIKDFALGE